MSDIQVDESTVDTYYWSTDGQHWGVAYDKDIHRLLRSGYHVKRVTVVRTVTTEHLESRR